MWILAGAFALLLALGGAYETWAVRYHPELTITQITKRRTHLMILVYLAVFTLFGYTLGVGGK